MDRRNHLGWPNRITIGRMLLIGPFVVCLLNLNAPGYAWARWAAVVIFTLMGLSDLLDGYLARRLHDESPLGRFLDPLADKLLITTAVLILCIVGVRADADRALFLPNWVAVAAIGKDLLVSAGFLMVYLSTGRVFIQPRRLGKWCTGVQLAMVLCMLLWIDLPSWLVGLPRALWILATLLAVAAMIDYIRAGSQFVADAENRSGGERGT